MSVLVHIHHEANSAAHNQGEKDDEPVERLNANHCTELSIGDIVLGGNVRHEKSFCIANWNLDVQGLSGTCKEAKHS